MAPAEILAGSEDTFKGSDYATIHPILEVMAGQ